MARKRRGRRRERRRIPLRKALFVLPNLFTLSSVFCGFYAIVLASDSPGPHQLYRAALAVFFGIFFDMADGRVARMTRTQSDFGVQLDSLADLVTFGVAPAVLIYKWGLSELQLFGVFAAFVYIACGAMRLARFNVLATRMPGQTKYFIGLPIPLAAGLLVSLVMFHQRTFAVPVTRVTNILLLVVVLSYLMISNVRYRTFKDMRLSSKSITVIATVIIVFVIIGLRVRATFALLALFSTYVLFGLAEEVIFYQKRRREDDRKPAQPVHSAP